MTPRPGVNRLGGCRKILHVVRSARQPFLWRTTAGNSDRIVNIHPVHSSHGKPTEARTELTKNSLRTSATPPLVSSGEHTRFGEASTASTAVGKSYTWPRPARRLFSMARDRRQQRKNSASLSRSSHASESNGRANRLAKSPLRRFATPSLPSSGEHTRSSEASTALGNVGKFYTLPRSAGRLLL